MHLLPPIQDDERTGYPSASEYGRLLKCRASHLLAKKARALGQVAHERSEAADLGTKKHLANTESPEILSEREREGWESCQRKRVEFIEGWSDASPIESIKESRLWLIISPYWDFESVTYSREELDRLYQSVLVVVASLVDPGEPVPGDHCHFCKARLICGAAKDQADQAMLVKVVELPLGEQAARLLDEIKRAQALFKEIEAHYKRVLEEAPGSIPGWALVPGHVRRSIEDVAGTRKKIESLLPLDEFLSTCSVSVPQLEKAWAKKSEIPIGQARELFKKFLGGPFN